MSPAAQFPGNGAQLTSNPSLPVDWLTVRRAPRGFPAVETCAAYGVARNGAVCPCAARPARSHSRPARSAARDVERAQAGRLAGPDVERLARGPGAVAALPGTGAVRRVQLRRRGGHHVLRLLHAGRGDLRAEAG